MIDTCQASSMYDLIYSPNIIATSSSLTGEDSFSHQHDGSIGVHLIDRYTYHVLEFMENVQRGSRHTLAELVSVSKAAVAVLRAVDKKFFWAKLFLYLQFQCCPRHKCSSTVGVRTDLFPRKPENILVTEFFGATQQTVKPTASSADTGNVLLDDISKALKKMHDGKTTLEELYKSTEELWLFFTKLAASPNCYCYWKRPDAFCFFPSDVSLHFSIDRLPLSAAAVVEDWY